jgi:hypothetical protein
MKITAINSEVDPVPNTWWCDACRALSAFWRGGKVARLLRLESTLQKADLKERQRIAHVFNTRYVLGDKFFKHETGVFEGPEDGFGAYGIRAAKGNAWMCPTCNAIHAPIRMSTFIGLIYPSCCEYPESDRCDGLPRIGTLKRPIGMFGLNGIYQQKRSADIT